MSDSENPEKPSSEEDIADKTSSMTKTNNKVYFTYQK
jgi:hypothetical protein